MTMGPTLTELNLSNTLITRTHLEILFHQILSLKILRLSSCPLVDGQCMQLITQISHTSLRELYVDHCALFQVEPLLWMAGAVGINSAKLAKLRTLDLSYCPLVDHGLHAISGGLHAIRYLNLEGCESITDTSLTAVVTNNRKLLVLNVSGCTNITSKSIIALAKSCPQLVSLNLCRCAKVTSSAMNALTESSHHLQALNLAGVRHLSEGSIFRTVEACHGGLLLLNVTGCEQVTINGLRSLITGLQYVVEAKTYVGFKPMDEHLEKKLMGQLNLIYDTGARKITQAYHQMIERREESRLREIERRDKSARIIQNYLSRYMLRVRFYYKWRAHVKLDR
jgi:hypothetical protein